MQWFDVLVMTIVIATLLVGLVIGFIRQAGLIAGIVFGAVFAGQLAVYIYPQLTDLANSTSPAVISVLSYIIAFLAIFIAIMIVAGLLHSLIKAIKLNPLNRIAGAVFCVAVWIFALSVCLNLTIELDRNKTVIKPEVREHSIAYPYVRSFAYEIIPYLRFEHIYAK